MKTMAHLVAQVSVVGFSLIVGSFHTVWAADKVVVIPLNSSSNVAALEARIAALEALLVGVTRELNTIKFSGVNVQIVNGSGTTFGTVDGLGNLIVGYNEIRLTGDDRTGSHNIVVGVYNNYSSYGGFIAGTQNTSSGPYASVSGGYGGTASGSYSSVSGGYNNTAIGTSSSVSGGFGRSVSGVYDWRAGTLLEEN